MVYTPFGVVSEYLPIFVRAHTLSSTSQVSVVLMGVAVVLRQMLARGYTSCPWCSFSLLNKKLARGHSPFWWYSHTPDSDVAENLLQCWESKQRLSFQD